MESVADVSRDGDGTATRLAMFGGTVTVIWLAHDAEIAGRMLPKATAVAAGEVAARDGDRAAAGGRAARRRLSAVTTGEAT